MTSKNHVIAIGAYPPPVHGFSDITEKMSKAIGSEPDTIVHTVTRTPPFFMGRRFLLTDLIKAFWGIGRHAILAPHSKTTYIGLSGGGGLYVDLLHIALARVRKHTLWLHHHNYTYITKSHPAMVWANRLASNANHIFLCQCMEQDFKNTYKIDLMRSAKLSNVSFRPSQQGSHRKIRTTTNALRVGFLSNITSEKGIFLYFRIMESLKKIHPDIKGLIAGPVDKTISHEFKQHLQRSSHYIDHMGPVYGAAKKSFFDSIDILLFPSIYANEAEPVTIAESLSHSVPVVATNRGCISEIDAGTGLVIVPAARGGDEFEACAIEIISGLATDPSQLAMQTSKVAEQFPAIQKAAATRLQIITEAISQGRCLPTI